MNAFKIASLYSAFAALATLVNLISQEIALGVAMSAGASYAIQLAMLAGTAAGLATKYFLDARYIFKSQADTKQKSAREFLAYSLTGVATTLIFWGFELSFDAYFQTKLARYSGAAMGLTLGYCLKYQLDKQLVFVSKGTVHAA